MSIVFLTYWKYKVAEDKAEFLCEKETTYIDDYNTEAPSWVALFGNAWAAELYKHAV